MPHRVLTDAFRARAVSLVRDGGLTLGQAAEKLACSPSSIATWCKAAGVKPLAGRRCDPAKGINRVVMDRLRERGPIPVDGFGFPKGERWLSPWALEQRLLRLQRAGYVKYNHNKGTWEATGK